VPYLKEVIEFSGVEFDGLVVVGQLELVAD
jgi:hypothetical protein